jgi:hypothetical protein
VPKGVSLSNIHSYLSVRTYSLSESSHITRILNPHITDHRYEQDALTLYFHSTYDLLRMIFILLTLLVVLYSIYNVDSYNVPPPTKRNLNWESNFEKLKNYKEIHGDCNVPQLFLHDESLGRWVRRQRYELKNVTEDYNSDVAFYRRQKLQQLGFTFDQIQDSWMKYYQELKEFKNIYGHTMVSPYNHSSKRWKSLSLWVRNQRSQYIKYQKGKSKGCFLTKDRIQLLEEIGFQWHVQNDRWMDQYRKLLEFQKKFGTVHVPTDYQDDPSLSRWVSHQRYLMRRTRKEGQNDHHLNVKGATLSPERIQLLNDVGFLWEIPSGMKGKSKAALVLAKAKRSTLNNALESKQPSVQNKKKIIPFPWDEI